MSAGKSGLNTNNKFVFLMENKYAESRRELFNFVKSGIVKLGISCLLSLIMLIVIIFINDDNLGCILSLILFELITNFRISYNITKTIKEADINKTNKILFGQEYNIYEVNETDVLDTTLQLNTISGLIKGRNEITNMLLVVSIIECFTCTALAIITK